MHAENAAFLLFSSKKQGTRFWTKTSFTFSPPGMQQLLGSRTDYKIVPELRGASDLFKPIKPYAFVPGAAQETFHHWTLPGDTVALSTLPGSRPAPHVHLKCFLLFVLLIWPIVWDKENKFLFFHLPAEQPTPGKSFRLSEPKLLSLLGGHLTFLKRLWRLALPYSLLRTS